MKNLIYCNSAVQNGFLTLIFLLDEVYTVPHEVYIVPREGYTVPREGYTVPREGYIVPREGYTVPREVSFPLDDPA